MIASLLVFACAIGWIIAAAEFVLICEFAREPEQDDDARIIEIDRATWQVRGK